jgi:predicted DsbA family dithiol-disulfide isomerase
MSEKKFLEIDAGAWLDHNGIEISVFIGEACEPCYVESTNLRDLIDKEYESFVVPGRSGSIDETHFEDVEKLIQSLKDAHKYAIKRAREMGYE